MFPLLGDLSKRKAFEEMAKDYRKVYGSSSGRVDEFLKHWEKRGGITKESIIEKTYSFENLAKPLFACLKTGKG